MTTLRFRRRVSSIPRAALLSLLAASVASGDDTPAGDAAAVDSAAADTAIVEAAAAPAAGSEPAAAVPPIDRSLLLSYLADTSTFTLIDARSEQEYAVGHIFGAVNVPHDAVDDFVASLPEQADAPLVVYCRTGKRASLAAEQLAARGYTNVRVLGPGQIFWSDTAPMFNCGVPASQDPPNMTP
ncbi:MAG: rhodanese-like domain-containing protein, partial [Gammaproteobacteria bacterium]|nr:rhodanese-like domain-containing protein [Gammaproteobacteria bacterium]